MTREHETNFGGTSVPPEETRNKKYEQENMSDEVELLSMDLNTVETTLPVIRGDIYDLRVKTSEILVPEDSSKPRSWKLTLETTTPTTTTDDKPVDIGHPIFAQTQLKPTGKATAKMVVQNVGEMVQSVRPRLEGQITMGTEADPIPWHKMTEGRMVRVRVDALPSRQNPKNPAQTFRPANMVSAWIKNQ